MGPDAQRRVEDSPSGLRAVAAHRLGLAHLPDGRRRGGPGAGRPQGAGAHDGRPALGAPRQRRHRQAPHDEGAGAGPGLGRRAVGADRLRRPRVRPSPPPRQLCRPDHGHRRRDGGGLLRARRPVRLRPRRQPEVEGRRRQVPAAGAGDWHLAGAVRKPGDHPARRERGQAVAAAGLRHQDRQASVADAADGRGQLVDAGPRDGRRPRPSW